MPNTLGRPYIQGKQNAAAFPLIDPRWLRQNRARFLRDDIPQLKLANSIYVPSGKEPTRAFVLVSRQALNALGATSGPGSTAAGLFAGNFQLSIDECVDGGNALTFKGLSIVNAKCCTRGIEADPGAAYLVELTDARGVLRNPWVKFPMLRQYNLRAPAYPDQYYEDSLDITMVHDPTKPTDPTAMTIQRVPWTWARMIGDVWGSMSTDLLGDFPGLPASVVATMTDDKTQKPSQFPEGWSLVGVSALDALDRMLQHLGCTIGVDLTAGQHYTVVNNGDDDDVFDNLVSLFADRLEDDLEFVQPGSGRVPGTVVVLFHRRNQIYGTEETIRPDTLQWVTGSVFAVSVAAPAVFNASLGVHYLWDDFTVRADADGLPLDGKPLDKDGKPTRPDDVGTANAIAAQRAQQYFNAVYNDTLGSLKQRYTGVLPFYAGANADGVVWRQDHQSGRLGWTTTVVRNEPPVFPELEGI